MNDFDSYHVDPKTTQGDTSGRYPKNFVAYPWFLKSLSWGDALAQACTGKPAYRMGNRLLEIFDAVNAPAERWGTAEDIGVLRQCLVQLSKGFDQNPYLSPIGRVLLRAMATGYLKNRVATITFYEANREFIEANGRFKAPLIITGCHRTGTTLLHRLLSEDPNTRSPFLYEMEKSLLPLKAGADPMQDPRIKKSAAAVGTLIRLAPGFIEKIAESHPWSATEKEESLLYMQFHNGLSLTNGIAAGRNYYRSMHRPQVADALLKYERNFFTMLDAYCPARTHWTLKAPAYAPYFGKIFQHYPDARVVVTHRHPSKNFASVCRLQESTLLPFDRDGSFDKLRFGRILSEETSVFLSRPLEFRLANPQYESQIMDCLYQDLMRDPIGMVKRIYARFGLNYTQEFEDRMKRYFADNQQGKHGRHKYSNEEYGIDPRELYKRNKAYFDHYGFKPEAGNAD